jgi:hypothetical protein
MIMECHPGTCADSCASNSAGRCGSVITSRLARSAAIAALDNAEAVQPDQDAVTTSSEYVAGGVVGVGAAEAQRRVLDSEAQHAIVRADIEARRAAARTSSTGRAHGQASFDQGQTYCLPFWMPATAAIRDVRRTAQTDLLPRRNPMTSPVPTPSAVTRRRGASTEGRLSRQSRLHHLSPVIPSWKRRSTVRDAWGCAVLAYTGSPRGWPSTATLSRIFITRPLTSAVRGRVTRHVVIAGN